MKWRYPYHIWESMHEPILKPLSKAQNSFWIKSRTEQDVGQFLCRSINKAIPSFRNSL